MISHHTDKQKKQKITWFWINRTQILHASLIFIVEKTYFGIKVKGPHFIDKNMIFYKKFFWVHIFRWPVGIVKNKKSIKFFFQHLLNLVLGKVKIFEGPSYHGSRAIAKMLRGASEPWEIGFRGRLMLPLSFQFVTSVKVKAWFLDARG